MDSILSWFEIPTNDIARAQKFYENVLQNEMKLQDFGELKMAWFLSKNNDQPVGALIQNAAYVPNPTGGVFYFKSDDIEATLNRVKESGGKIINQKQSIGEFGFVGHFEDTEGNRVGLHTPKSA